MFKSKMMLIVYLLCFVNLSYADLKLKYASIIYRHGDMAPVDLYPTDPWKNESLWPVQFGELSNTGIKQQYALGKWLRNRYLNLISEKFDPNEIYVRSTDVDHTLMSAQANLAGMYPPSGGSVWKTDLLWRPIPVHTQPEKDDEVLAMKRKCPLYDKEKEKFINSADYQKRLETYQPLMNYLTEKTGKKIQDVNDINNIYNDLYIETLYNFTLPNWTESVYPDKLREPACYSFSIATATPMMSRIITGPLLKEIFGKMDLIVTKKPKPLKLSIYSGHDFTIGNVLSAMGMYDGNCPVYTATIIFELLFDDLTNRYFVRVLYRNSIENVDPLILKIPHCGKICNYQKFIKLYANFTTMDWNKNCIGVPQEPLVVGSVLVIVALVLGYMLYKTGCTSCFDKNRLEKLSHNPKNLLHSSLQT